MLVLDAKNSNLQISFSSWHKHEIVRMQVMKVQMKMGKYVPDAVPEVSAQPKSAKMIKVDTPPTQKINFVGEFLSTALTN